MAQAIEAARKAGMGYKSLFVKRYLCARSVPNEVQTRIYIEQEKRRIERRFHNVFVHIEVRLELGNDLLGDVTVALGDPEARGRLFSKNGVDVDVDLQRCPRGQVCRYWVDLTFLDIGKGRILETFRYGGWILDWWDRSMVHGYCPEIRECPGALRSWDPSIKCLPRLIVGFEGDEDYEDYDAVTTRVGVSLEIDSLPYRTVGGELETLEYCLLKDWKWV